MKLHLKIMLITFIAVFCLISCQCVYAQKEIVLNNGIRVFIKPMRAAPVVTISFWVKNGSIYESEGESGFSELVSKMIFLSSLNFSNHHLESEIKKLGLKVSKNSSNDCQSFSLTGASKNFERILQLGVDGLFKAVFSEKDIKNSIQELKNEIQELESRPDVVVHNAMMQEAFAIHPCRRPYYGMNPNFEGADAFILNLAGTECLSIIDAGINSLFIRQGHLPERVLHYDRCVGSHAKFQIQYMKFLMPAKEIGICRRCSVPAFILHKRIIRTKIHCDITSVSRTFRDQV